jgi:hypothetical protein
MSPRRGGAVLMPNPSGAGEPVTCAVISDQVVGESAPGPAEVLGTVTSGISGIPWGQLGSVAGRAALEASTPTGRLL